MYHFGVLLFTYLLTFNYLDGNRRARTVSENSAQSRLFSSQQCIVVRPIHTLGLCQVSTVTTGEV
jgi:hypothetical protein